MLPTHTTHSSNSLLWNVSGDGCYHSLDADLGHGAFLQWIMVLDLLALSQQPVPRMKTHPLVLSRLLVLNQSQTCCRTHLCYPESDLWRYLLWIEPEQGKYIETALSGKVTIPYRLHKVELQPTTISPDACFSMGNKGTHKLPRFWRKLESGGHPARKFSTSLVCHGYSSRVLQGFHSRGDETFRFVKCKFISSITGTSGTMATFLWENETGTSSSSPLWKNPKMSGANSVP